MRLLVGLGNPEPRHAKNRHNIGFMAVDGLVRRHEFAPFRAKFSGAYAEGTVAGERVIALKPMTFMNLSGESVGACARFFKIEPEEIAVIHDELDLAPGKLRVKRGGGTAGHNGLRSIDEAIGPDFWRVRIGIGHPGVKELVLPYVLQNFDAEEMAWVTPLVDAFADALPLLIRDDVPGFMSKVALILKPPAPKPPRPTVKPDDPSNGI
ncbi:MAG TPA: aminoacyl-tRNA hydrolase [Stellaceae bacterium]|jgi:PTH1 family peptidyl-tRNA hydrolase|nr:aminoacyl-tRNA hydrolase [Stellaceae bacterium]